MTILNYLELNQSSTLNGLNLSELQVDEAYMNIFSNVSNGISLYSLSADCMDCPFIYKTALNVSQNTIKVSTKYITTWRVFSGVQTSLLKAVSDKESVICEEYAEMGEFGVYELMVDERFCKIQTLKDPVNIYGPIVLVLLALICIYFIIKLFSKVWHCFKSQKETNLDPEISLENTDTNVAKNTRRIRSIDVFRGFSLCLMIFVNDGGGQYSIFNHSTWHGLLLADVVFPWFLWIMGLCIGIAHKSSKMKRVSKLIQFRNILWRSLILFMLGLSVNTLGIGPVKLSELRIMGVLQRIAICYLITSVIGLITVTTKERSLIFMKDVIPIWPQWFIHLSILLGYSYMTIFFEIPDCPSEFYEAGGIQNNGVYQNCTGGATGYIDKIILGEQRLWKNIPLQLTYMTKPFDPENLLGCLTCTFQTFLGFQAGYVLLNNAQKKHRFYYLLVWGILCSAFGAILILVFKIPLNKSLWTSSFMFMTSSTAFVTFAFFYYLIDYTESWHGYPFNFLGTNSILVYVGHEICFQLFPWHWKLDNMNTHFINLIENVSGVLVWILITAILYYKKIFITV